MAIPKKDDSGIISAHIKVEYEWKPPHCSRCKVFGHDIHGCPKSVKEQARTKDAKVAQTTTVEETDDGFKEVQTRRAKAKGKKLSSGINMSKGPTLATKKQVYVPKNKTQDTASSKAANASSSSVPTSNPFGVLDVHDSDVNVVPSASTGIPSGEADLERPSVSNTVGAKGGSSSSGTSSGIPSGEAVLEGSSGSTKVADKGIVVGVVYAGSLGFVIIDSGPKKV
ncbi:zinc knuckle CX2CX4HX4C [Artemisia annua]|uniref:Zinc knuckle CX2CX4HX4C n=1 Tax=Artemisia annua TaxID=35608 RepID=A0A2U1Q409_ARTAN|nr:zinc knuckle CX2CX4HX4C [Artemisia annua]